jgi:hypothetical protein
MQIEAQVDARGTLHAELPEQFRGKRVRVQVQAIEEPPSDQWEVLSRKLDQLEQRPGPKLTHAEILATLRAFRESE